MACVIICVLFLWMITCLIAFLVLKGFVSLCVWFVCLCACLSVPYYTFVCFVCMYVCMCVCVFVHFFACLVDCLFGWCAFFKCLYVYNMIVCVRVSLNVHLYIHI